MSDLVIDTENNKEFIFAMNNLVSNDKIKREEGLNLTKKFLIKEISNYEEVYKKIWKSLFYFFWNVDKNQYQFQMAKKIASFIYKSDDEKELIDKHENWISIFINEFMRKFQSVDFLRSDKYLMLSDQIISTYLVSCLKNKKMNSINKFPIYLENEIKGNNYNFSFEGNMIRIISRFVNYIFKNEEKNDNVQKFIMNNLNNFFNNLLSLFLNMKDKREMKLFEETIIVNFINSLNNFGDKNIKKNIIDISKEFIEKNNNILINFKKCSIDLIIKKLEDEKYEKKQVIESSVDPVNKYILEKNYTAKIRKSTYEKKKEIEKEKEKEKKIKEKEDKKNKKESKKEEIKDKKENKKEEKKENKDNKENSNENKKEKEKSKNKNKKEKKREKKIEEKEEEIIKEEIIKLTPEVNKKSKKKKPIEKKEIIEEDELIEEEDEEMKEKNDDDDEENESEENNINLNEDDDFDDFDNEENEIEEDELFEESNDEDEEEISDAYKNQIRNSQITKINNYNFLGRKTNNNNKVKKKKVKYALENNVTNVYDKKKPIILTSKKKELLMGETKKESLLRK